MGAGHKDSHTKHKSIGVRTAAGLILGVVIGSGIFSSPGLVTTVSLLTARCFHFRVGQHIFQIIHSIVCPHTAACSALRWVTAHSMAHRLPPDARTRRLLLLVVNSISRCSLLLA